jgi:hypothetical protein
MSLDGVTAESNSEGLSLGVAVFEVVDGHNSKQ